MGAQKKMLFIYSFKNLFNIGSYRHDITKNKTKRLKISLFIDCPCK